MTQQEIYRHIAALPFREQKELVEKLSQNLKLENGENGNKEFEEELEKETPNGNELSINERIAIAINLSGCLRPEAGFIPMTREEEREVIEEYLEEKYS